MEWLTELDRFSSKPVVKLDKVVQRSILLARWGVAQIKNCLIKPIRFFQRKLNKIVKTTTKIIQYQKITKGI